MRLRHRGLLSENRHPKYLGIHETNASPFLIVARDGDREYWATSDLGMGALAPRKYAEFAWCIAVYHRGLKQHCGVERA